MRELFEPDIKKLKEEDRRFLLSKSSTEMLFNLQENMNNRLMGISIFAMFLAIASLIVNSQYNTYNQKLFVVIVLIILSAYLIYLFIKAHKRIRAQNEVMINAYDALFKFHFGYSKKGEIRVKRK
jgi:UDP-N-acetylmuramyl pentapeptide phosphotransferase/UDP-N-acetylglucosamine-1-phosphate transferase